MKYGIQLGGGASVSRRDSLKKLAAAAEELGFDSLLIGDHIVIPKQIHSPWPYDEYVGGQTPYAVYTEMVWLDPFDTMAFLAAITERIRLGISVVIVPYRHPFDVARRVATIDVLSGGRFIMGIGVGWLEDEFRLLNIPFKERGARTREYIAMMQALWTQDSPRFSGKFVELQEDVNVLPRPLKSPIPLSGLGENPSRPYGAWPLSAMAGTVAWSCPSGFRPAGSNQGSDGRGRARFSRTGDYRPGPVQSSRRQGA